MEWEKVGKGPENSGIYRSWVPGGWLVLASFGDLNNTDVGFINTLASSITFYPDPEHQWDPDME